MRAVAGHTAVKLSAAAELFAEHGVSRLLDRLPRAVPPTRPDHRSPSTPPPNPEKDGSHMLAKALPTWAVRVLAAVLALALLVATIAVAMLLPHIPRLAHAAAELPEALEVVDRAPDTLDQVQRIDRNVETITPPVAAATKDLSEVAPHIATLAGQVDQLLVDLEALQRSSEPLGEAAPKIARLSGQLEGLQTSLRRLDGRLAALDRDLVEPLNQVRRPLRTLADTTGPLPDSLDRLNRSTAVLEQLPGYFDRLQRTLNRVARHVRNLDEKTGPNLR